MGLDIKMSVSQIRTDRFIEINTYTFIMFRLHEFDSQLQCTIELNHKKTWTKHIESKQTFHDMHHNKSNEKVLQTQVARCLSTIFNKVL